VADAVRAANAERPIDLQLVPRPHR
jgi:hypothetical protein